VQLSWFPSVEYAGFYAALENGYYADEKLDVTLVPGGPEVNALDVVQSGSAQFGISTGDSLILAKSKQQNFVAVATIFRNNPLVAMSLADSGIQKPEDLAGKTVGVIAPDLSSTWDVQFLALMRELNVDTNGMKFIPISDYQGANELKAKNMDAMSGMFATNEPVQAAMAGDQLNLIYYKDYGVDVYSNVIFTSEELTKNNSDLVSRMVKATMKGYQYAIENPDKAAELTVKYDPTLDLAFQKNVMVAQIPFIDTGDAPIGSMDSDVWDTTQQILLDFNLITSTIDLNSVYTNQFVGQ
jgi:ABC-type nitrate/sulfonate/bicarbonate transport system substrate-binding protein